MPQRLFFVLCGLTAALLLAAGTELIRQNGFPDRINSTFVRARNAEQFHVEQFGGKGYSFTGILGMKKPGYDLIITGDSFVLQYAAGLDQLFQQHGLTAKLATDYACIIGPDITLYYQGHTDEACTAQSRRFFKLAEGNSKPVIFSLAWAWYPQGISDLQGQQIKFADDSSYEDFLVDNLRKIRERIGMERPFLIIGNPPGSGNRNGIISCLNRPNFLPNNCLEKMVFPRTHGVGLRLNKKLRAYAESDPHVWFFDPFDVFCGKETCAALDVQQNAIWYSDGGHLSIDGSRKAVAFFSPELLRALQQPTQ